MYPEIKTILYATDMGEHMRPVFRFTIELAEKHEAEIIMLHVAEPLSSGVQMAINVYMPDTNAKKVLHDGMKKMLGELHQRLDAFCEDELGQKAIDCKIIKAIEVVSGKPSDVITHQAEKLGVDVIVVGTHTDTSFSAHLIGSTARRVTQFSKIPVLVVPVFE
jgi:nucleotide-binding universal stress UspA family protein